jgi:hypothetical protein
VPVPPMSDDDFRRMSESQLIDMTLAAEQGGFGGADRMRYARAQAELNRREREHQNSLAAQCLQIAEAQAEAANAAAQSSRNAARVTWGLVYLGILIVLVSVAGLGWHVFSALQHH